MTPADSATARLADSVRAIIAAADRPSALRLVLEWASQAVDGDGALALEAGLVVASAGSVPDLDGGALATALATSAGAVGNGPDRWQLAAARLDIDPAVELVVARAGGRRFAAVEIAALAAAVPQLSLGLRLAGSLRAQGDAVHKLEQRQKLLDSLSSIQRGIARRVPLPEMLDTITRAARDLLGVENSSLRLIDPLSPLEMLMVSSQGLSPDVAAAIYRIAIGEGASGRAVAEGRVVIMEDYSSVPGAHALLEPESIQRAMAAPVRDGDAITGAIVVATKRRELAFGPLERDALVAFAEHAGLAITDAKRVDHIQRLAFHDELTGLPNRGLLMERLEQALIRARRGRGHVAVLFLDLDRFKTINDSLGHSAGDQLLVAVAQRLRQCLRGEDTAARLGGDEFAILALCDRDGAVEIAERVVAAMDSAFRVDAREVLAATSIGIALSRGGRTDAGGMLRDADTAMYRAKAESRGGYVVFTPSMHAAALARIDLEEDLRGAVGRGEVSLDYQPIVDLAEARIVGFEALIRWHHPVRGLLSPLEFIPFAEETGQIHALGRWILDEACIQVRHWQLGSPRLASLFASVNVSPRQLQDPGFVEDVARSLARSGLAAADLVLEITEGAVISDVATAIRRLESLRLLGVSVAIDDFGKGHSSLGLLRRLPVDTLKVDKMFVDSIAADPTAASFLEAIVRMAEILSLHVVVEGIETAAQAAIVAGFGDVLGQGYALGRPSRVAAVERLLAEGGGALVLPQPPLAGALAASRPRLLRGPSGPPGDDPLPRAV